jgi:hypothetical protein
MVSRDLSQVFNLNADGSRQYYMRLPPMAAPRTIESMRRAGLLAQKFGRSATVEKGSGRTTAWIEVRDEFLEKNDAGKTNGRLTGTGGEEIRAAVLEVLLADGTLYERGPLIFDSHDQPWVWPTHKGTSNTGALSLMGAGRSRPRV